MKRLCLLVLVILLTVPVCTAWSQPLRLAIAANAQFVIKKLQEDFRKKTGIKSEAIVGSSGNLAAQIRNGAPFDIFLSADMDFPNMLYQQGFALSRPKEYAAGSLIVCGTGNLDIKNWRALLAAERVNKVAIANPSVAPYGKAAQQVLQHYQLWNKVKPRLVYGESISKVNTYVTTGTVTMGFTTEALIYEYPLMGRLKWERVDRAVYGKISQGFIILSHSKKGNYAKAQMFSNYLLSPAAKKILKQSGYQVL